MKKIFLLFAILLFATRSYSSHILGAYLSYAYLSGTTYKITLVLYGDCSPASSSAFGTLLYGSPSVCIYDGSTYKGVTTLAIDISASDIEVTPLCTGDSSQCTNPSSSIPGIKKFVYSATYTLPYTSSVWRFIYGGYNGSASAAGRSASITNLASPGSTIIQLIDTLNNTVYHNTSPSLNPIEQAIFCLNQYDNYDPLASDPDGDSLNFALVSATNGIGGPGCPLPGSAVAYTGTAWPGNPIAGATPIRVLTGSFFMDSITGKIMFNPNLLQRDVVVYNIREFRAGLLVGTSQREMTFSVVNCPVGSMCTGMPEPGTIAASIGCAGLPDALSLSGYSCAATFQWQSSTDTTVWVNIPGAVAPSYPFTPTAALYYRCAVLCPGSGLTAYSAHVYFPLHSATGIHCIINAPDTVCHRPEFYTATCSVSPAYNVTTFYGDGTWDNTPLTTIYPCHANVFHNYTFPGTFTVHQVLYDGTLPIDSATYSYHYPYCRILPFELYYDANYSCTKDPNERLFNSPCRLEVDSNGVTIDTISATSGFYYMAYGPPGTVYQFKVISTDPGILVSCPSSGIIADTIQATLNDYPVKRFAMNCSAVPGFDLTLRVTGTAGGHATRSNIFVENKLCPPKTATLIMYFNPKYTYEIANPPATSYTSTTATWIIDSVSSAYRPYFVSVRGHKTGPAEYIAGDTVLTKFVVIPSTGDADSTNNIIIKTDTINSSCDPNYIEVTPAGYIASGTKLKYVIHFENTGTDTAFNIHVMDTLSDYVDPSTLTILAASADMKIARFKIGGKNIVKFDFPNINLLDSSHHGFSEGVFAYTINSTSGLSNGTLITNRAGIYFDAHLPVITNTVENIICDFCYLDELTQVRQYKATLFPNPVTNELIIRTQNNPYQSITITNQVGQILMAEEIQNTITKVDVQSLPAGVYYIALRGNGNSEVQKFIKM